MGLVALALVWGLRYGVRRTLRSSAGSQERDQQDWPEQVADVLDGVAWREVAGLDDIHDMDDGRTYAKDSHRDHGGLTEAWCTTPPGGWSPS